MEQLTVHPFGTRHIQVVGFRQYIEDSETTPLPPQPRFQRTQKIVRGMEQELGTSMHFDPQGTLIVRGRYSEQVIKKTIKIVFDRNDLSLLGGGDRLTLPVDN